MYYFVDQMTGLSMRIIYQYAYSDRLIIFKKFY